MGTHPIFESDFDCLTDGLTDRLNQNHTMAEVEAAPAPVVEETPAVEETPVVAVQEEAPVVEEVGAEEVKPADAPAEAPVESCATKACCDEPKAAPAPAPEAAAAGAGDAEDAAGKQTRAQKKMMKAMSKLNLKHVPVRMKVG